MTPADLLHALDRRITGDTIRQATDHDLTRIEALLDHWQKMAAGELTSRRRPHPQPPVLETPPEAARPAA